MPRRPGGKYKGAIKRLKCEATLKAEADAREKIALEHRLHELQARQEEERKLAARGLQSAKAAEEEAKKQRIANALMGSGNTDTLRKYFANWKVGHYANRQEVEKDNREKNWRMACTICAGVPGGCGACTLLNDVIFDLPFDAAMRAAHAQGARPAQLGRSSSTPTLPPLRPSNGRGLQSLQTSLPQKRSMAALPPAECTEEVAHWATGRRCLLDREKCRMVFMDRVLHQPGALYHPGGGPKVPLQELEREWGIRARPDESLLSF